MQKSTWMKWFVLLLFTLCVAAGSWGMNSVTSLGPTIKETMQLSATDIGALMASFYVGTTIMAFIYSIYFDRYSEKVTMTIGLILIGGFVLIASFQLNFWRLLLLLAFAGSGYGLINPAVNKGIMVWFPAKIRGTAMSLKQIGVMVGSGVSAVVLPLVAGGKGIETALLFSGGCVLIVAIMCYFLSPDTPIEHKRIGVEEQKAGIQMIFRDRNLLLCNVISMIFVGAQFSFFMYVSLYMREEFLLDIAHAGIILSLASLGAAVGRILWGLISDFVFTNGRKKTLVLIGTLSSVFGVLLAWIPVETPIYFIYIVVIIYGMTIGGWNGVIQVMVVELAEARYSGIISGINLSFIYLSTLLLPFLFGLCVELLGNYRISWTLSAISVLIATLLLFRINTQQAGKGSYIQIK